MDRIHISTYESERNNPIEGCLLNTLGYEAKSSSESEEIARQADYTHLVEYRLSRSTICTIKVGKREAAKQRQSGVEKFLLFFAIPPFSFVSFILHFAYLHGMTSKRKSKPCDRNVINWNATTISNPWLRAFYWNWGDKGKQQQQQQHKRQLKTFARSVGPFFLLLSFKSMNAKWIEEKSGCHRKDWAILTNSNRSVCRVISKRFATHFIGDTNWL